MKKNIVILMLLCIGSCTNSYKKNLGDKRNGFQTILLEETVSGDMLYFQDVDQYKLYLQDSIEHLTDNELQLFLSDVGSSQSYYPLINLTYETPALNIYFIACNKGKGQGLYLVSFKDKRKVQSINLSHECPLGSLKDLGSTIVLDERVTKGENYSFNVFPDNFSYTNEYFSIEVSLSGKIEVEKIKLSKWEVP